MSKAIVRKVFAAPVRSRLVEGDIDHRDKVLTQSERQENRRMMVCCSRARSGKIVLAL